MATLKATYTSLRTLKKHGFDRAEFDAMMADFGKTTRDNNKLDVIEIIEAEDEWQKGQVVDTAHPICIGYKGQWFYDVLLSEMETCWTLDGDSFSTITDDIETKGFPLAFVRAMRK